MRDSGTVGCSYYSAQEETLYLMGDIRFAGNETIDSLILQTKPTVLLASSRIDYLTNRGQNSGQEDGTEMYLPYQLDIRPSQEFSGSNAKSKLTALEISATHEQRMQFLVPHGGIIGPEEMETEATGFTLQEGRLLHMSSSVDMENAVTIGCAGAILTHLQRRRATDMIPGNRGSDLFRINSVRMFGLKDTMFINGNALLLLQILQSESHPSMFNQGPGKKAFSSKKGLSIYGIFHRFASTPQGRNRLRQDFLRPSTNIDTIRERHNFISVFLRSDNFNCLEKMTKGLKHIKDLRPVMINLRKGISTGSAKVTGFKTTVWATLLAFAFYGIDINEALRELSGANALALRSKALQIFESAQLYRVGRMIQEIVDIDSSDEQSRTIVKPGLDRELDMMKDNYDGLNSLLKQVAMEIATTIPENFDIDVNVIYFPQLGFNIAIPLNDRGEPSFNGADADWELIFITENRAYFKDLRMREMDDRLGDIYGLICGKSRKEIEIVYYLAQKVLRFEDVLVEASDICGQIDSLIAMTQAASCYKLVRPKVVQENVIKIKGGRHILQELTVPSYVPNDTFIIGEDPNEPASDEESEILSEAPETGRGPSMLLLTGPNYSGKSVYMKQVALIIYLAQVGSFVPAESAEVGITDNIMVKMNTQESVSKIQSTFMNDLQQVSLALKQVTSRSLLLIDEFGKGTLENDGIGLACGILEHLLSLRETPKVIAATHFHEIFENDFLRSRPRLQLGHMEVQVCEESRDVEDQITYLYNFRPGRSNKSFGTICAAINGINQAVVTRANELASLSARGENLIAACATLTAEETQALEEADALARGFLEIDMSDSGGTDSRVILEELFESLGN
ncbi:hypothetical protein SI65_07896 [Aspergillus cristatus]|uniref:DNA mismatch repair protein MSH5 n=1 Tax=Aspergillus cristatus TaxID=573508 RepID=A0A1E3B819_ASPCR|nr:hypothetical protein SI65_07896 [Aspergillus cristatus]